MTNRSRYSVYSNKNLNMKIGAYPILLAILCSWHVFAEASTADESILLARDVAAHVHENQYGHKGASDAPNIRELPNGEFDVHTDCSGFVTWVLNRTAPVTVSEVESYQHELTSRRKKWPQAYVYQRWFASLPASGSKGWKPVPDWRTMQAGDVLAWCADKYCQSAGDEVAHTDNTGHIMFANGAPERVEGDAQARLKRSLDDRGAGMPARTYAIWSIPLVDSSASKHYDDTTRSKAKGLSGVGTGRLYFALDRDGKPLGVQFPGGVFLCTDCIAKDGNREVVNLSAARPER